jgi:hypothetical protein
MNNKNQQFQGTPQPPPTPPEMSSHSPSRAALFALIPGIGAVYNREYIKAVVHLSVFAGLVIIAESVGIFGLLAFSFYVYTIFDSYRSAEIIARRSPNEINQDQEEINLPFWGGIILLMGILFLLDNLGAISLRTAFRFWPMILIALGGYLIVKYVRSNQNKTVPAQPIERPESTSYTPPQTSTSEVQENKQSDNAPLKNEGGPL